MTLLSDIDTRNGPSPIVGKGENTGEYIVCKLRLWLSILSDIETRKDPSLSWGLGETVPVSILFQLRIDNQSTFKNTFVALASALFVYY